MDSDASCDPLYRVACLENFLKSTAAELCTKTGVDCSDIHAALSDSQRKAVCDTIKSMNLHHQPEIFKVCEDESSSR